MSRTGVRPDKVDPIKHWDQRETHECKQVTRGHAPILSDLRSTPLALESIN